MKLKNKKETMKHVRKFNEDSQELKKLLKQDSPMEDWIDEIFASLQYPENESAKDMDYKAVSGYVLSCLASGEGDHILKRINDIRNEDKNINEKVKN